MKKNAVLGVVVLAGILFSTSSAQPANAQMLDVLKNALGGQIPGLTNNSGYPANVYNNPYYNAPSNGNGIVNSLLPLVQNSSVGSSVLNSLTQSQYGALGAACPTNITGAGGNYAANYSGYGSLANGNIGNGLLGGSLGNKLLGNGAFGNPQPAVYNGMELDSSIYSGPYRGTSNQVESAMNLDWAMTVLKQQINLGASQGYLSGADANLFSNELGNLIAEKRRVVRRNGLSYEDSQNMVAEINDLVLRVRDAWYRSSASNNAYGSGNGNGWGRHHGRYAEENAYGQILSPGRNQALEDLYLKTQPVQGFRH